MIFVCIISLNTCTLGRTLDYAMYRKRQYKQAQEKPVLMPCWGGTSEQHLRNN